MNKSVCLKCGQCPFFTGEVCHGHGEYWGNCSKMEELVKTFNLVMRDYGIATFDEFMPLFKDSECRFIRKGFIQFITFLSDDHPNETID